MYHVGDFVIVRQKRECDLYQKPTWVSSMDDYSGQRCKVIDIGHTGNLNLEIDSSKMRSRVQRWWFNPDWVKPATQESPWL